MRIYLISAIILFNFQVFAQDCIPKRGKNKRLYNKIENQIKRRAFYSASDALSNADNIIAFSALRTELFWYMSDFYNAEREGRIVIQECPEDFPKVYFFLAEIAFNRKDYVTADQYLSKCMDLGISEPYFSDVINLYSKAKILAQIINNPVSFNPRIVKEISTENDEYLPIISPDQELVFFTRRYQKNSLHSITNTTVEEFVMAKKLDEKFDVGDPLPYPFNMGSNEGGASVTIDNNILYFTKCIRNKKNYNNCDIFYSKRLGGKWSEAQKFSGKISKKDSWDSQPTVSSDGSTIIFASDREGGYGKTDLYVITFKHGEWSDPKNLGSTINSSESEKSPFLHADGKTLFFASKNFPSIGGFDIFFSRKDSLGKWQKPVNIGYPINSTSDEISFFVSTDGRHAYFASNQLDGVGGWDIYSFDLHDDAKPQRILFLKGNLIDKYGKVIENVNLEINNLSTKKVTRVNVNKGSYVSSLTLDRNDDVLITVKRNGYAFYSKYISSKDSLYFYPNNINIELESLENGKSFKLSNVNFETNSYEVNSVVKQILIEFADYLKLNSGLIIEINGFTDNIGDDIDNQLLSENRARAVMEIILSNGIDKDRISYNGFGEKFPLADNSSEKGRAVNRRTEFKIIKQ